MIILWIFYIAIMYIGSCNKLKADISSNSGIFAHYAVFINIKVLLCKIGKRRVYIKV